MNETQTGPPFPGDPLILLCFENRLPVHHLAGDVDAQTVGGGAQLPVGLAQQVPDGQVLGAVALALAAAHAGGGEAVVPADAHVAGKLKPGRRLFLQIH